MPVPLRLVSKIFCGTDSSSTVGAAALPSDHGSAKRCKLKGAGVTERDLWRKLVGVEPTFDAEHQTAVLKTVPGTGQD